MARSCFFVPTSKRQCFMQQCTEPRFCHGYVVGRLTLCRPKQRKIHSAVIFLRKPQILRGCGVASFEHIYSSRMRHLELFCSSTKFSKMSFYFDSREWMDKGLILRVILFQKCFLEELMHFFNLRVIKLIMKSGKHYCVCVLDAKM